MEFLLADFFEKVVGARHDFGQFSQRHLCLNREEINANIELLFP